MIHLAGTILHRVSVRPNFKLSFFSGVHKKHGRCGKGYFCQLCCRFIWVSGRPGRKNISEIKESHKCGDEPKHYNCFCENADGPNHYCDYITSSGQKNYDHLCFLHMMYCNLDSNICEFCDSQNKCQMHENKDGYDTPNVSSIYYEEKDMRENFSMQFFCEEDLKSEISDCENLPFEFKYLLGLKLDENKSNRKKTSYGNKRRMSHYILHILSKVKEKKIKTIEEKILTFLLSDYQANEATVICSDVRILHFLTLTLLSWNLSPKLLEDHNKIFILTLENCNVRFIAREKYLDCDFEKLGDMFQLECKPTFFPVRKNHPYYYSYKSLPFDLSDYVSENDSAVSIKRKTLLHDELVESCLTKFPPFEFAKALKECAINDGLYFCKSMLTFLREMLQIQKESFPEKQGDDWLPLIHPFTYPICSISGFSRDLFHFHSLEANLKAIDDSVLSEKQVQISQKEHQLAMALSSLGPHIKHSFSQAKPQLLDRFGSMGDIYDEVKNFLFKNMFSIYSIFPLLFLPGKQ